MIEWKRLYMKPAGSLPGGVVTQWGVGAITVFILLFLTYWIVFEGGEPAEVAGLTEVATTPPRSFTQQMTARVDAETTRAETNKAAELRAAAQALRDEQAEQQRQAQQAGLTAANQAAILAGPSPDTGQPYTQGEWELRERLRLEAVERRSRSLRSSPVAQSYRKLDGGTSGGQRIVDDPAPAKDKGAEALQQALTTFDAVTTGLEDEIAAEAQADQAFLAALRGTPATPEAAPAVPAATAASATAQDYSVPARLEAPQDPPVFDPLSFLFWGWFRAMITYSLYAVIAGAVLRVFSAVGIAYITSMGSANMNFTSLMDVGLWTLAIVPFFTAGMLASLKIGELASMLVTGGGAGGSGLMGMVSTAGMAVASGGTAAAAKAGGAAAVK